MDGIDELGRTVAVRRGVRGFSGFGDAAIGTKAGETEGRGSTKEEATDDLEGVGA